MPPPPLARRHRPRSQVLNLKSLRLPATVLLGVLAVQSTLVSDRALAQGDQIRRALYTADTGARWNTTAAGFIMLTMANL